MRTDSFLRNQQTLFTGQEVTVSLVLPQEVKKDVIDQLASLLLGVVLLRREPLKEKEACDV